MSMPIQRQSEQFGYFDDGPRFARDRASTDLPRGLAALINTSGPRITGGMLNTRTAGGKLQPWTNDDWESAESHDPTDEYRDHPDSWSHQPTEQDYADWEAKHQRHTGGRNFSMGDSPFSPGWGPRDHGGAGPDGGPLHPPSYYDDDEDESDDEEYFDPNHDPDRFIPESQVDPRMAAADPDLRARYAAHIGSRHPFDRTAGAWEDTFGEDTPNPFQGDPEDFFTNWLERGPKPGENYDEDKQRHRRGQRTAACQLCGGGVYHISGEGFVHSDTDDHNGWDIDEHHRAEPDAADDQNLGLSLAETGQREGRRVALAPEPAPQDPAMAPQMPVGGGFMPGHRIGLDWRNSTVPGTVIANDGQVHIRWDDGQHTSEDPTEVRLL